VGRLVVGTGTISPVERLTAEVGTLRDALRRRAYVEQATGLLAGRLDCSLNAAFQHLAKLALDTDTTLSEAAALLLAEGAVADVPRPAFPADAPPAAIRDGQETSTTPEPAADPPVPACLVDLVPVPAMLLSPVTDDTGKITDFVIERHNNAEGNALRDAGSNPITGQRLLQVFPDVRASGLLATLIQTFRTGKPLRLDLFPYRGLARGQYQIRTVDIRGQRTGDWLLVTWRGHDMASDRARRLEVTEQLGGLGWAEWNMITATVTWSCELYAMHGQSLADGPLSLADYRRVVHPDDVPVIEGVFRGLAERGENIQAEYRILVRGEVRYLRLVATAVFDPLGALLLIRGVFQDVTARRRAEQALTAARDKIERERREATLKLQQAILPSPEQQFTLGQYDVSVRYRPAQPDNRVGGDWYDARPGPDGGAIVAIGDISGHGLVAAAGMARIGNALRGLSATGQPASTLLGWLNATICADESPERIASAVVGWLDPGRPALHWAQAGHPPPVLVRDGEARLLARPAGLLLGTMPTARYELATEDLFSGDLLLFYTDGLVERRDADIDEGLIALLKAASDREYATARDGITTVLGRLDLPDTDDDVCLLAVRVTGH
jgi:serine phosphatase RsbU (regulator of sigma subunit)